MSVRGLALAALLAVAALSGCGAHPIEDAPSLDEVATATRADPYRFEYSLRAEGLNESVSSTATGAADPVARRGTVRYVFDEGGDALTTEVRQIGDVTYTRFSGLDMDVGWTKEPTVDAEDVLGPFGAFSEPHRAADALARHGRDVEAGPGEAIDGVPTTHYRATIATVELLGMGLTEAERDELEREVRETGSETATVEAWAGTDGVLRRLDFRAPIIEDGERGRIISSTRFFDFAKPVAIEAPPASEIDETAGQPCSGAATPHAAESVMDALRDAGFSASASCYDDETTIFAFPKGEDGDDDNDAVFCSVTLGPKPNEGLDGAVVDGNVACAAEPGRRAVLKAVLDSL